MYEGHVCSSIQALSRECFAEAMPPSLPWPAGVSTVPYCLGFKASGIITKSSPALSILSSGKLPCLLFSCKTFYLPSSLLCFQPCRFNLDILTFVLTHTFVFTLSLDFCSVMTETEFVKVFFFQNTFFFKIIINHFMCSFLPFTAHLSPLCSLPQIQGLFSFNFCYLYTLTYMHAYPYVIKHL